MAYDSTAAAKEGVETFLNEYYNKVLITESPELQLRQYYLQSSYRMFSSRKGAVKFGGLGKVGRELKAKIIKINMTKSPLHDSVAVKVAGYIMGEGEVLKREFTHSLILQPNHTKGGYHILNEIFRSLKDDEEDASPFPLGLISNQNISTSYRTQPWLELEYHNDMVNNMAQTTMSSMVDIKVDQVARGDLAAIGTSQAAAMDWTIMYGKKKIRIGWSSQDLNTLKLAVLSKKQTSLDHASSSKKPHELFNLLSCAIDKDRSLAQIIGISEIDETSITWLTTMTGLLGEFLVFTFLRVIYGEENVKWINENEEKGEPLDILIHPDKEIEVKATVVPRKNSFSISKRQWRRAGEKKEYYSFVHVTFCIGRQARIREFANPTRLVDEGLLLIKREYI